MNEQPSAFHGESEVCAYTSQAVPQLLNIRGHVSCPLEQPGQGTLGTMKRLLLLLLPRLLMLLHNIHSTRRKTQKLHMHNGQQGMRSCHPDRHHSPAWGTYFECFLGFGGILTHHTHVCATDRDIRAYVRLSLTDLS